MSDEELDIMNEENIERRMKMRKKHRSKRRTHRKLRFFTILLRIAILVGIVYLCYHIIYMKSWRLPADTFSKINNPSLCISNNKIVPSYKILSAIRQIEIEDKAIFLIKTDDIKESIMRIEPIQNVYVRRFWFPARIDIVITERVPAILIAPNETVAPISYFTKDGKLIGHEYMPLRANYKTIKVLAYCTKDNDYRKWDLQKQIFIRKLAKTVEYFANEPVEYIDYRNPEDVYIKLHTVMLRLGAIDIPTYDDAVKRLSKLPSLLPQVKLVNKQIKYLDLRWDKVYYLKLNE